MEKLLIENGTIIFKDFSGKRNRYSDKRMFSVRIDSEQEANNLLNDGWNVKRYTHKNSDDVIFHLPVEARFNNYPPKVYMITDNKKVELNEDTIDGLDDVTITSADITISPSKWTNTKGESGVKAYLRTLYAVVERDEFAHKYDYTNAGMDDIPF